MVHYFKFVIIILIILAERKHIPKSVYFTKNSLWLKEYHEKKCRALNKSFAQALHDLLMVDYLRDLNNNSDK
jgi:hypothetical protein